MKSAGLRALDGLFTSVSGPDGLTPEMNGQLISVRKLTLSTDCKEQTILGDLLTFHRLV